MPKEVILNPTQEGFVFCTARFSAYIGGVGSGKTASGAIKAVTKINAGEPGIIVGPELPHFSRSTWPEASKWFPWSHCKNAHLDHPYTQKKILQFEVGGKPVDVYYGGIEDEASWTGPNVNWVWFDEGARKDTRKAFDVLAARIRIGKNPQMWITTTPRGMNHWLYEIFVKGIFPDEILKQIKDMGYEGKLVEYFTASTEENKHNLDPITYLSLRGLYSGKLQKQEVDGMFVTLSGQVWEVWSEEGPFSNVAEDAEYISGVPVEWWVDDGFTRGHPRVILMAQVVPPYINVFDEYAVEYELPEVSIEKLMKTPYPKPTVAYIDSSAATFASRLWDKDIDTVKSSHDVVEGIKHTTSFIRSSTGNPCVRFHPRCSFAIKEIPAYTYDDKTGKPRKESDNASDALRYGLWNKRLNEILEEGKYNPFARKKADLREDPVEVRQSGIVVPKVPKVGTESIGWYLRHLGIKR